MIVVGAGPAGLTAAYLLAKKGHQVDVWESASGPGGLWRGIDYGPHHFESGMHWYSECGVEEIDAFWRKAAGEVFEIPREIAGCWFNGKLQLNTRYPDARGSGLDTSNLSALLARKFGCDNLTPSASRQVGLERVVLYDDERTRAMYERTPDIRRVLAWPEQRTLPLEYQSGLRSFYPRDGLRAMARRATERLRTEFGVSFFYNFAITGLIESEMIWAAGLKAAVKCFHGVYGDVQPFPEGSPPPLEVTCIHLLVTAPEHDLHYAFDFDDPSRFRVTWYANFTDDDRQRSRVTVEFLGPPRDGIVLDDTSVGEVLGTQHLGRVFPVPTVMNEMSMHGVREQLATVKGLHLIGSGAEAGLFFQPEILRAVEKTVESVGNYTGRKIAVTQR